MKHSHKPISSGRLQTPPRSASGAVRFRTGEQQGRDFFWNAVRLSKSKTYFDSCRREKVEAGRKETVSAIRGEQLAFAMMLQLAQRAGDTAQARDSMGQRLSKPNACDRAERHPQIALERTQAAARLSGPYGYCPNLSVRCWHSAFPGSRLLPRSKFHRR